MGWKSTTYRYGAVAVAIHWTTAVALVGLVTSGFLASGAEPLAKAGLIRVHAAIGLCVLALTLLRIAWWLFADRKPAEIRGSPRWQADAARLVHRLFYRAIVVMAASGIGMLLLSGAATTLLGGRELLPDFTAYPPRIVHGVGVWLLIGLTVFHIGAALHHQFVRRDRPFARMGFWRPEMGDLQ